MANVFLTIVNMSFMGAFIIAAICIARLPLKKAPKIISYCLWAVVAFRLICPISIESSLSLIPYSGNAVQLPDRNDPNEPMGGSLIDENVSFMAALEAAYFAVGDAWNGGLSGIDIDMKVSETAPDGHRRAYHSEVWIILGSYIWSFGVTVLFIYGITSYVLLKRKMHGAVHISNNIYEANNIKSPFVLGIFKPKIYLPFGLSEKESGYVLLHEQTHIKRHDHIVKFGAYFVLCLHWFNPLAWVAFILMSVDMEMSCDERVLKEMGSDTKKDYSLSLLSLATEKRIIGGSPLAFGEGGIKQRIKNVLNFKKPPRMIIIAAVALAAALSVGFAVNRASTVIIELPNVNNVSSITMNQYNNYTVPVGEVEITDPKVIQQILDMFSGSSKTGNSYNDQPNNQSEYMIVRLNTEHEEIQGTQQTLYLYTNYRDYIEIPYNGIYRPKESLNLVYSIYSAYFNNILPNPIPEVGSKPVVTLYGFDQSKDNGSPDTVRKHFTSLLIPNTDNGFTVLTDMIFIDVWIPEGTVSMQTYYAGADGIGYRMSDNKWEPAHQYAFGSLLFPCGNTFSAKDVVRDISPESFTGSIWAVSFDADGIEHKSDVIPVIWSAAEQMPTTPLFHITTLEEAREIVDRHYPNAAEIRYIGGNTISYTNPPAPVEVYSFEIEADGVTVICAVSKERGIFFTYSNGEWGAFTGLREWKGATRNMTLDDVRAIAQKIGTDLTMGDLRDFIGTDVGSGIYVMRYFIEDSDYILLVGSSDMNTVMYAYFGANESIDIRYYDVDKFIKDETKELVRPLPEPQPTLSPSEKAPQLEIGFADDGIEQLIQAAQLTHDWYVVDEKGDGVGIESDSPHPLQLRNYDEITFHWIKTSGKITLYFSDNYPPQSISVKRWNAKYAGTESYDEWGGGEAIEISGNQFSVNDDGNSYIYEVYAKWEQGSSHYAFRVNKMGE